MQQFKTLQILNAIANWPHQPFTLPELNLLLKHFANPENGVYYYGESDIESFILETLSELLNQ